ncbi:hypothetical protein BDW69DRAFT_135257 [Aspergillus filifer]
MEVVGGISAIISLLDVSIDLFKNTRKDLQLSETFEVVRRQLPVLRSTLDGCYRHLDLRNNPVPDDVAEALEKILDACEIKAKKLKRIFAKIIPDESDPWQKRYAAIIQRLGRGNKVEELMRAITKDVQTIVNYDAVKSADPQQNSDLEKILEELKSLDSSVPEEDLSSMNFTSHGGPQHNYIHKGHGSYHVNSGSGRQYNAEHQSFGKD